MRFLTAPPARCRTVLVGAGLAGTEIAAELVRRGDTDVLVVEAGPGGEMRHVNVTDAPSHALRRWLKSESDQYFHRPWTSASPPHYTGNSGLRRRVGGRSLYWYGVVLPIEDWALCEPWWPAGVTTDLTVSWAGGAGLYARMSARLRDWRGDTLGGGALRELAALRLTPTPLAVREAPAAGTGRWYAYSPLDAWRDPVTGARRVTEGRPSCLPEAEVTDILVRGGAATGVLVRHRRSGEESEIAAGQVVLCAGTVENSRLAIQALLKAGALDKPRLGGLTDHIVQGFFLGLRDAPATALLRHLPYGSYFAHCAPELRSALFVDVHEVPRGLLLEVRIRGEQISTPDSYVSCEPAPGYPWRTVVMSRPGPADRALIAGQRHMLESVHRDIAALMDLDASPLSFASYEDNSTTDGGVLRGVVKGLTGVATTWSNRLGTEEHEGGTLAFGRLLTDDHEFHQLPGLFAAGPATFPRPGAANPSLTTLALAHRLADRLADPLSIDRG